MYLVTCHGLEYRPQTAQSQRAPAPSTFTCPGSGDEAHPEPKRDTMCNQCLTPVLKKKETEPHDMVSSLLPFLMGGGSAQLLDCGDMWL